MALIVEDGTGLANAESYESVANAKAYWDARGMSYAGKTDLQIEQALRRATTWMDAEKGNLFTTGYRVVTDQALLWPLSGVTDRQGYSIPHTAIPRQWRYATIEAAYRELMSPGSLAPDVTPGKVKKRVRVEGAVEVEYAVGSGGAASQTPVVSIIDGILAPLIARARSVYSGRAVRA